ncbi:YagU family protein [Vibrio cincinnatiensis]|uniref:YagU family protein n=1 Tax=Vibrio cincinnatiensis TaxID=675 RepID=UPI001FAA7557
MEFIRSLFVRTPKERRHYGVALFIGIISGVMSAFVKWGAEVPLPPRTISDGRAEFNPPYIFLRDYLGIDPTQTVYTFAEHIINPVMVTHIIFSLTFAIGYCVIAEIFPKVKMWQGVMAGLIVTVCTHGTVFVWLDLTPTWSHLPASEYISEIFGHIVWFWSIEMIRGYLREKMTKEPDPEVVLS